MGKTFFIAFFLLGSIFLTACAGTIPTDSYIPQNHIRYENANSIAIGVFTYSPTSKHPIAPNQIQNTAVGSVYISSNVSDFVKRATALELEKTGLRLSDLATMAVSGDVLEFMADDLGYSIHWTYCIRYKIIDQQTGNELYSAEYRPDIKKTGKFGLASDFSSSVNDVVLDGYTLFAKDAKVRALLDSASKTN